MLFDIIGMNRVIFSTDIIRQYLHPSFHQIQHIKVRQNVFCKAGEMDDNSDSEYGLFLYTNCPGIP